MLYNKTSVFYLRGYYMTEVIKMSTFEIVCGISLLIAGFFLIFVVILQEGKDSGLSGAIQGGSSESFLNTGGNRTKDAKLRRATTFFAIMFFLIVILTNVFAIITKTK